MDLNSRTGKRIHMLQVFYFILKPKIDGTHLIWSSKKATMLNTPTLGFQKDITGNIEDYASSKKWAVPREKLTLWTHQPAHAQRLFQVDTFRLLWRKVSFQCWFSRGMAQRVLLHVNCNKQNPHTYKVIWFMSQENQPSRYYNVTLTNMKKHIYPSAADACRKHYVKGQIA